MYDIDNPPIVDTQIFDNFFSDDEINQMLNYMNDFPKEWAGHSTFNGEIEAQIYGLSDDVQLGSDVHKMIVDKMHSKFGNSLHVADVHILESLIPYRMHTDGIYGQFGIDNFNYGAYTCVCPLETVNSNTIIFDQWYAKTKNVTDWIKDYNPPKLNSITEELYQQYFTGEVREHLDYLSVETIFPWTKGSMLVASRYKFHCSDNYLQNAVTTKKALIMWCALPFSN